MISQKFMCLPSFRLEWYFILLGQRKEVCRHSALPILLWANFTDFNVAHSHMTMYGSLSPFLLWAAIYALLPKITGNEPKQPICGNPLFGSLSWDCCLYDFADGWRYTTWPELDSWRKLIFLSHTNAALLGMEKRIGGTLMFISASDLRHIISTENGTRKERCWPSRQSFPWKSTH